MRISKEKTKKERSAKKLVTGSALAAIAAAGLTWGALFSSPGDLLNKEFFLTPPFEITDTVLNDDSGDGPDFSPEAEQEKKQKGIRAALRRLLLKLPVEVRAFAGVPLWMIGRILLALIVPLFQNVLAPAWMTILKYLCIAGLIFAALTLSIKAVCPDVPLKKIITGRKIAISAATSILFGAIGVLLQIFYTEGIKTYEIIESGAITVIIILISFEILKIRKDKKKGMAA